MRIALPQSYPDELLFSLLARFRRHAGALGPKETLDELFGKRSVRASVDFQCHLGTLAARLHPAAGLTAERLARDFTLFPYYTAFQPSGVARFVLRGLVEGPGAGLHFRLGIASGGVRPPSWLRFCPACHAEARERWGERYWSRVHQLPGVLVCPEHEMLLIDSKVAVIGKGQHDFIVARHQNCPARPHLPSSQSASTMALLVRVAHDSAALLNQASLELSLTAMRAEIVEKLIERGLACPSGRVDQKALAALQQRELAPIRTLIPVATETAWLMAIVRKHRSAFHPLYHILLNILLDHADARIEAADIRPAARRFLADDPAFSARLRKLVAGGASLRGTARILGVDPKTVCRHTWRLGLKTTWTGLAESHAGSDNLLKEKMVKTRWLEMQNAFPSLGRTAIRHKLEAEASWLRRNDREWLEKNSPAPTRGPPPRCRLDWEKEDRSLVAQVNAAAARLRMVSPPARVTAAALEREIGRPGWIGPRKAKLPRTIKTLSTIAESIDGFRQRRVGWARASLLADGESAPDWKVMRRAGIRGCRREQRSSRTDG